MDIYMYAYTHTHTHTHTHMYQYICIHTHIHTYIYVCNRYALTIVVAPLLAERIRGTTLGDLLGLPRVTSKGFSHGLRLPYLPGRGLYADVC